MNTLQVAFFAVLVAVAAGAPLHEDEVVPIVYQSSTGPEPDGSYAYKYETANGISANEQGEPRRTQLPDAENEFPLYVQGQYSYQSPDGTPVAVAYVADEFGFHPTGEHLPTPPPVPVAIQRALEYIAEHPEEEHH